MASSTVDIAKNPSKSKSSTICGLCEDNSSKYCCPRCEVYYCSLDCYKSEKHSQCSETFYRDCVNEDLAGHYTDDASRQKMIEILKKMSNEEISDSANIEQLLQKLDDGEDEPMDSDDENFVALESRVKDINLDDSDAVWDALTQDEKNEFEALLNHGNIEAIVPQWTPWWEYQKKEKKVEDITVVDNTEAEHLKNCPKLLKVPKFSQITNTAPSPTIRFNIANCIASYAFMIRYFNGEVDPVEGASYLLHICDNLNCNANYEDPEVAVESVAQKCLQSNLIETDKQSLDVMKHDVYLIFNGPSKENSYYYYSSALSDMHRIFQEAKKKIRTENTSKKPNEGFSKKFPEHGIEHLPPLETPKLKMCIKKLEYYLSFLESCTT